MLHGDEFQINENCLCQFGDIYQKLTSIDWWPFNIFQFLNWSCILNNSQVPFYFFFLALHLWPCDFHRATVKHFYYMIFLGRCTIIGRNDFCVASHFANNHNREKLDNYGKLHELSFCESFRLVKVDLKGYLWCAVDWADCQPFYRFNQF